MLLDNYPEETERLRKHEKFFEWVTWFIVIVSYAIGFLPLGLPIHRVGMNIVFAVVSVTTLITYRFFPFEKRTGFLKYTYKQKGFDLVSGGSDNHLILIDLRNKVVNGSIAALALETANIVVNKNSVPFDEGPPFYPAGIRLGTPVITTRGMKGPEMVKIAGWFAEVVDEIKEERLPREKEERKAFMKEFRNRVSKNKGLLGVAEEVRKLTAKFPVP